MDSYTFWLLVIMFATPFGWIGIILTGVGFILVGAGFGLAAGMLLMGIRGKLKL